jgi:hypothetical protein
MAGTKPGHDGVGGAETSAPAGSGAGGAGYCDAAAYPVSSLRMILPPFTTNFTR